MFRFKQFNVDQAGCAMKINTDGVLLGALAETDQPKTILDIGTGTGVIALMLAQRFADATIDAVEIDETASATAKRNFAGSSFARRLSLYADSFENHLSNYPDKKYDLIVSNPPFYINSLESPGARKSLAKHTDQQFFETLIKTIAKHLTAQGSFWLILPLETAQLAKDISSKHGLNIQKVIKVLSYPGSVPHREILVLTLGKKRETDEQFVIYAEPKVYSEQYQTILKPFFTIF
ncbi:tRNA1(Val) (adenine(37)-N6)-methyltransferase [Mucilaginibacter sp. UR6-11]|uniref:tRNA1(Val) (adenine(37)-N6)-methyltransferase n=1 Tax=Mucilaginibacter sp. UR6-11 TaxID=1435644 RepID=UPI001E486DE9|nr:methyltransferase [Mucilaginibacter sp. UR6-11]MCC8426103.1 methyltransferase [Mucilaginibacter sp. UR6-11]